MKPEKKLHPRPDFASVATAVLLGMTMSGCAVVAVADAAVSVASATVSVAATAVKTTAKVAAAGVDAVIPDGDEQE